MSALADRRRPPRPQHGTRIDAFLVVLKSCTYHVRFCVLYCSGRVLRAAARVGAFVFT